MFGGASTPDAPLESETRWVGNVVSDLSKSENLALAHMSSRHPFTHTSLALRGRPKKRGE